MAGFAPTHPGEILLTEFLEPMGITQYRIAKAINVPARRINEIVHGKRGITADTALRLSRALGVSDMFFSNMQAHYDAEVAREDLAAALATIERIAWPGSTTYKEECTPNPGGKHSMSWRRVRMRGSGIEL